MAVAWGLNIMCSIFRGDRYGAFVMGTGSMPCDGGHMDYYFARII